MVYEYGGMYNKGSKCSYIERISSPDQERRTRNGGYTEMQDGKKSRAPEEESRPL